MYGWPFGTDHLHGSDDLDYLIVWFLNYRIIYEIPEVLVVNTIGQFDDGYGLTKYRQEKIKWNL